MIGHRLDGRRTCLPVNGQLSGPCDFPIEKNAVDPGFNVNKTLANMTLEKTENTTINTN
jgi:hypothetical protein